MNYPAIKSGPYCVYFRVRNIDFIKLIKLKIEFPCSIPWNIVADIPGHNQHILWVRGETLNKLHVGFIVRVEIRYSKDTRHSVDWEGVFRWS